MPILYKYLLILCILLSQSSFSFTLITDEEARKEGKGSQDYVLRLGEANALPSIKLVNPDMLASSIKSPISIELKFEKKDAPILPETFRALYGSLQLDVTERILEEATIDSKFLKVDNAKLPRGRHTFVVQIADANGRLAKRMFKVKVR